MKSSYDKKGGETKVTLVTGHDRLLPSREDKIFAKALVMVLMCTIGMIILTVTLLPGLVSSLLSYYADTLGSPFVVHSLAAASEQPKADMGKVSGFITGSSGSPVQGASIVIYKHEAFPTSDQRGGYSKFMATDSNGQYSSSEIPSGVYRVTVTYPGGESNVIENYAVWPSSSSSYNFVQH
jgi:Carboxypeptidase regulatory-like domain